MGVMERRLGARRRADDAPPPRAERFGIRLEPVTRAPRAAFLDLREVGGDDVVARRVAHGRAREDLDALGDERVLLADHLDLHLSLIHI